MKISDEQLQQIRQEVVKQVGDSDKQAVANAPFIPAEKLNLKDHVLKLLPKKMRGYAVALVVLSSTIIGLFVTADKVEQAWLHQESGIYRLAVELSDVKDSSFRMMATIDWHDPFLPDGPPSPANPYQQYDATTMPTGTSNSASHPSIFSMFSGDKGYAITASPSDAWNTGTVNPKS